ncbi:sigma-70 family RNA polymerase sigma factor [Dactylosporangium siamense]|uniref:RNA polymerase sigma24 factor n=1 Tax=Dactylosporangium siamense TaxID=685454 RepID=A0A919PRK2_9ACTN|nr:sigma-70 family RNA polymerase sigma factor [Dactylosporangium siamense]GIG49336.1 RNA polymerase sigma24 factor [Dactylosporangium siamense]
MNEEFLAHRRMLLGLAYRMLGTLHDAEDVLQEAYLRWTRADRSDVVEPRRYLTRVVTRLAVDALRARQGRREEYVGTWLPEPINTGPRNLAGASNLLSTSHLPSASNLAGASDPIDAADLIDTSDLSIAVLHLMERLTPPQRAVYVLRTAFELPYTEIAAILDRSEEDSRQLHHRAGAALAGRARFSADPAEHTRLLEGFVAAARDGDVERLEQLLHEDVVAWNDGGGRVRTGPNPIRGRAKVVRFFVAVMRRHTPDGPRPFTAVPTGVNGQYALLVNANYRYTMCVNVVDGRIQDLFRIANPAKLSTFGGERS